MSKYAEFDTAILDLIAKGINTMAVLDTHKHGLKALAEPFRTKDRYDHLTPHFRIIDRRLQALRKAGSIKFNKKVWEIAK